MRSENERRPDTGWRQMLVLAGAATLLTGCGYLVFNVGDLKDNPMDQAIATGIESDQMKETRDRLLKRYPIGGPVASVRRYLESVGAKCLSAGDNGTKVTCRYSKHTDIVLRTPLGDILEIRDTYDFRIELVHKRGLLRDVRVCRQITRDWFKGAISDRRKRIKYPMKCPDGQNTKGK